MESPTTQHRPATALPQLLAAALVVLATLAAPPAAAQQQYPQFGEPRLREGRAIWLETCEACHAHDIAGAPLVTDARAWAPRIAKGSSALYRSAVGGLTGPKGTQMPPRGGNGKLTDEQVRAAVDYMVALTGALNKGR